MRGSSNGNGSSHKGARATVHGAISIVNALATRKGATLGVALSLEAEVRARPGRGVTVTRSSERSFSSRLIRQTVHRTLPRDVLESHKIEIAVSSDIPAGFGLKSSSAISSAVALACARTFRLRLLDQQILLAGVEASVASKVSITGAYDDACSCYYGGFNVTNNAEKRRVLHQRAPQDMSAVIFIPKGARRGNLKRLSLLRPVFESAWTLACRADYWTAMTMNGLAVSSILGSAPGLVAGLIEKGAVAASVSGNGPAVAAVVGDSELKSVKRMLSAMGGRVLVSALSNKKAEVHDL